MNEDQFEFWNVDREGEIWLRTVCAILQGSNISPREMSQTISTQTVSGAVMIADKVIQQYRKRIPKQR